VKHEKRDQPDVTAVAERSKRAGTMGVRVELLHQALVLPRLTEPCEERHCKWVGLARVERERLAERPAVQRAVVQRSEEGRVADERIRVLEQGEDGALVGQRVRPVHRPERSRDFARVAALKRFDGGGNGQPPVGGELQQRDALGRSCPPCRQPLRNPSVEGRPGHERARPKRGARDGRRPVPQRPRRELGPVS